MPAGQSQVTVQVDIDDDVLFFYWRYGCGFWPARIGTVSVDDGEFILLGQPKYLHLQSLTSQSH